MADFMLAIYFIFNTNRNLTLFQVAPPRKATIILNFGILVSILD